MTWSRCFMVEMIAVALAWPTIARAQANAGLSIVPGTELRLTRLTNPEPKIHGRMVVLAGDTIVLVDGGVSSRVPISELSSLEVRGGEDKRRGFLIGAGAMAAVTSAIFVAGASGASLRAGDAFGTIIGNALAGGLVGYVFAPVGWERIPLPVSTTRAARAQP